MTNQIAPNQNEPIETYASNEEIEKEHKKLRLKKILIISTAVFAVVLVAFLSVFGVKIYNYFDKQISSISGKSYDTGKEAPKTDSGIQYGTGEGMKPGSYSSAVTSGSKPGSSQSTYSSGGSGSGGAGGSSGVDGGSGSGSNGTNMYISKSSGPVGTSVNVSVSGVNAPADDCFAMSIIFRPSNANYQSYGSGSSFQIGSREINANGGKYSVNMVIPSQVKNFMDGSIIATPQGAGEIDVIFGDNRCSGALPPSLRTPFTVL